MIGPVLIFDSGVGGLSIAQALRRHHPEMPLSYCCDNAWLPYGLRDDTVLTQRILAVCLAAVAASQASVLVVACNTASTLALATLRQALNIPVVGTVPAIKPAAQLSTTRHIALLATTATVNRCYTQGLIDRFAGDCKVTKLAADELVVAAEAWLAGSPLDTAGITQSLQPLWQATQSSPRLDTVVLGCTHFPLLKPLLATLAPSPLQWIDSADAIAQRVQQVSNPFAGSTADNRCFTTAVATHLTDSFAHYGFQSPQRLIIPGDNETLPW